MMVLDDIVYIILRKTVPGVMLTWNCFSYTM